MGRPSVALPWDVAAPLDGEQARIVRRQGSSVAAAVSEGLDGRFRLHIGRVTIACFNAPEAASEVDRTLRFAGYEVRGSVYEGVERLEWARRKNRT